MRQVNKNTQRDFNLSFKSCDINPIYQGEDEVECLLLNPCDGYHVAYARFEDGEFVGFYSFCMERRYEANSFYFAWAKLPDVVSEMLPIFEIEEINE